MKILFWTPPWAAHGDPLFYRNCLRKHLLLQANLLRSSGHEVEMVLPALLLGERANIDAGIRVVELPLTAQLELVGGPQDPSQALYSGENSELVHRIIRSLEPQLASTYDVILLWETPVPFLQEMYPDALVIHQMPGAFSRPPYPHTVTFDPGGLYRRGTLYQEAQRILNEHPREEAVQLARVFAQRSRNSIEILQPFSRNDLDPTQRFSSLRLLPLQVSAHYAFREDTPYVTQMDYLLDVLQQTPKDVGVVVTQYVTPRVQDTVMTPEIIVALQKQWPNLIYHSDFDKVSSVSQYLIPLTDGVVTCSSSIGLQGFVWQKALDVPQKTFLEPFATPRNLNISLAEQSDRLLSFLLTNNQPLASSVLEDAAFLTSLLEEMLARKRAGAVGLALLPSFVDLDPQYGEKLMRGFRQRHAAKTLGLAQTRLDVGHTEIQKFSVALSDPGLEVISFDVFDTLIKRPVDRPADAYKFLERIALEITDGIAEDFANIRITAEVQTRNKCTRGEMTLDEIYDTIRDYYDLDKGVIDALKEAEVSLEMQFVEARPLGNRLWKMAKQRGLPIYLISDMYLSSEVVSAMVKKAGYDGYEKLFLSCDYDVRKREGGLFDAVIRELKIDPKAMLHVGDHKISDFEQARKRGILPFRIPNAAERMRESPAFRQLYPLQANTREKTSSIIAGLTAHRLFDTADGKVGRDSHFGGEPVHLGYAAFGPMFTGYVMWLARQAKRDGISRLYFMSREGWLLQQMYDALRSEIPGAPPSTYLYASRRATRVAGLRKRGDVLALAGQPYADQVPLMDLLRDRFGLSAREVDLSLVREAGFAQLDAPLSMESDSGIRFLHLCGTLSNPILRHAAVERDAYLDYISGTGLATESNPAVVDIGWRANIQGALGCVIERPLIGYYYATLQGAEVWPPRGHQVWSYSGEMLSHGHSITSVKHRGLIEYLSCHVEPSLLCFRNDGGVALPVFRQEEGLGTRKVLINAVHQGAIQYAKDLARQLGERCNELWFDPCLSERAFAHFCTNPASIDAKMLVGHHIEDALGGIMNRYIVHPDPTRTMRLSSWEVGAQAAFEDNSEWWPKRSTRFVKGAGKGAPSWLLNAEAKAVEKFVGERKQLKYAQDRERFFTDSKSKIARRWAQWTSK